MTAVDKTFRSFMRFMRVALVGAFIFVSAPKAEAAFTTYALNPNVTRAFPGNCTSASDTTPSSTSPTYKFKTIANTDCQTDSNGFAGSVAGGHFRFRIYTDISGVYFDIEGFDVKNSSGSSKTLTITSTRSGSSAVTEAVTVANGATLTVNLALTHAGKDEVEIISGDLTGVTFNNFRLQAAGGGASAPGAPTAVTAQPLEGSARVSFTAPSSNGGAAITSYTVTSSPGGITATGSASPITVTGLTNGTAYTFTVTATNSAGTGAASSASSSVTPAVGIPTLSGWALIVFAMLMGGAMLWYQRPAASRKF